jgi:virginiamycin B lyase
MFRLFRRKAVRRANPVRFRPELVALESRCVPSTITEFQLPPLPTGAQVGAADVTAAPDGNVWFTDPVQPAVGRIAPSGQVTEFSTIGNPGGSITAGPDGNVWFVGRSLGGGVGRVTPNGQVTEFALPAFTQPVAITAGPDGNVWFTASIYPSGDVVGRVTPAGQITEFAIPVPPGESGTAYGITAGPDGNLWFLHDGGILARITPAGQITDHVADAVGTAITSGPDGNLWTAGTLFDTQTGAVLGGYVDRISLSGSVTAFSLGGPNSSPALIRPGPDGNLWFTEPGANEVGRISPAGQITLFAVPTALSQPTGITAGPNGNVWFTEAASRQLGEYFLTGTPPPVAAATATALASDVAAPAVGQSVHLTATVTSPAGTPGGTVTFFDGTTAIGTAGLDASGHAVLATVFQTAGSHTVTAVFNGASGFAPSRSAALPQSVAPAATTTTLTASANPAPVGHPLILTVTVTPAFSGAGAPTGMVILRDGNNTLAYGTLDSSGRAVFTFIPGQVIRNGRSRFIVLPRGQHLLTVSYTGDGNFAASASAVLVLTVV